MLYLLWVWVNSPDFPDRLVCQSNDDIDTLLDHKYVASDIEYTQLAMHWKCVLFLPTVVVTSEAQYFLACLGSTERFVQ